MTESQVCAAALGAAAGSLLAVHVAWWVIVGLVAIAVVTRWPVVVILLLVVVCGTRAHQALRALEGERGGPVAAQVTVLDDPVARFGRWTFQVRRGAERDQADLAMRERAPQVGERLAVRGVLRPLDDNAWARAAHLRARLRIDEVTARVQPGLAMRAVNAFRRGLDDGAASLDADRPLFVGIVLGDDRDQPASQIQRFRTAGLSHLLAVSGQNVAFVLLVAAPVLRRGRLGMRWLGALVVLGAFTAVTRAEPSVVRAVAMAGVAATAHLLGRSASPLRILAVGVLCLTVVDPLLWWSVGLQLSVAATTSLIVVRPHLARRLAGPRWWREALATVLAAQIGTFPLLASIGATTSVATVAANLAAVPVAGATMVWGLTAGVLAAVAPPAAAAVLHLPTRAMLWWIDSVATWASSPRWPLLGAASFGILTVALAAALCGRHWLVMIGRALLVTWLVVSFLPPSAGEWRCGSDVMAWRAGNGAAAMTVGGSARDLDIGDCVARHRLARLDLLVLSAPGAAATRQAALARDTAEVGTVIAAAGRVRNAEPLRVGRWRVGPFTLEVERREGRWDVRVV